MKDKFTYIDFQMYVLPGAYFLCVVLAILWVYGWGIGGGLKLDIFGSALFILLSFVFGNFWQAISHERPERKLKKEFWEGLYPSQAMFFPHNPIIGERARTDLLKYCKHEGLLSAEEVESCNSNAKTNSMIISAVSHAFDILRTSLEHRPDGERSASAEARFLFFRGMFVTCFWSGILALIAMVTGIVLQRVKSIGFEVDLCVSSARYIALLVVAMISFVLWRTFRWRCRGAAQGFAKEVVRAVLARQNGKQAG